MSDAAAFDPALLDQLARCFAEAAVRRLLAEMSAVGTNPLNPLEKPEVRTNRGPALLIAKDSQARSAAAEEVRSIDGAQAVRTIPEVSA